MKRWLEELWEEYLPLIRDFKDNDLDGARAQQWANWMKQRWCDRHFRDLVPLRDGKDNLYTHLFRCVFARIATYYYAPPTLSDIEEIRLLNI